jgi:glycosyltransferase involved in cell wall biosynthesis
MGISVVIPCHNNASWVAEALQSVALQTLQPREIILVDDASTDGSVDAARASGVPFTLIEARVRNAAAARNLGIARATGDWIAFLDADDWWFPAHLRTAQQLLRVGDDKIALMNHRHTYFGDVLPSFDVPAIAPSPVTGMSGVDFAEIYLTVREGWPTGAFVVERALLNAVGGFDERQVKRHDLELLFRLLARATWCYSPTPTWGYRARRPGSISSKKGDAFLFHLKAELRAEELFPDVRWRRKVTGTLRRCLSYSAGEGDLTSIREALHLASGRLDAIRRTYYSLFLHAPAIGHVRNLFRGRAA